MTQNRSQKHLVFLRKCIQWAAQHQSFISVGALFCGAAWFVWVWYGLTYGTVLSQQERDAIQMQLRGTIFQRETVQKNRDAIAQRHAVFDAPWVYDGQDPFHVTVTKTADGVEHIASPQENIQKQQADAAPHADAQESVRVMP